MHAHCPLSCHPAPAPVHTRTSVHTPGHALAYTAPSRTEDKRTCTHSHFPVSSIGAEGQGDTSRPRRQTPGRSRSISGSWQSAGRSGELRAWRLLRALAARDPRGYTCLRFLPAAHPRSPQTVQGSRPGCVQTRHCRPFRVPLGTASSPHRPARASPPSSLDLFLPSPFLGFNLKGGERECGPQLSSSFCARHRWKTITELFGNSLSPGSVAETWTQRPETRLRSTTRRGCPWGLID